MLVKNGQQFEESVLNIQICSTKEYIFQRDKEELGELKCVGGICEHEVSMFDLIILDCIILCHIVKLFNTF